MHTPKILVFTGIGTVGFGLLDSLWLTVSLFIISAMFLTASKFFPRVALEPLRSSDGKVRWYFTKNGLSKRLHRPRHALNS